MFYICFSCSLFLVTVYVIIDLIINLCTWFPDLSTIKILFILFYSGHPFLHHRVGVILKGPGPSPPRRFPSD